MDLAARFGFWAADAAGACTGLVPSCPCPEVFFRSGFRSGIPSDRARRHGIPVLLWSVGANREATVRNRERDRKLFGT